MASSYAILAGNFREDAPLSADKADRDSCRIILRRFARRAGEFRSQGDLVLAVGLGFLGAPYVAHPLDKGAKEQLTVNLRQFDCFTFVENALALARVIREGRLSFAAYRDALQTWRYREGRPEGYASRLHYFSDWLRNNEKKGLVRDVTRRLGGVPYDKTVNFISSHRDRYPALEKESEWERIRAVEKLCARRRLFHIPKAELAQRAGGIAGGDIIAVTTARDGLDVLHTGFALPVGKDLHLLHASQRAGRVVISGETLARYLAGRRSRLGIMVGRPL